jgi:hypothetical protein
MDAITMNIELTMMDRDAQIGETAVLISMQ